jgi:hypothetical protein
MISTGANPLQAGFWEPLDVDDMVFDALLGIFMFKVRQRWNQHSAVGTSNCSSSRRSSSSEAQN